MAWLSPTTLSKKANASSFWTARSGPDDTECALVGAPDGGLYAVHLALHQASAQRRQVAGLPARKGQRLDGIAGGDFGGYRGSQPVPGDQTGVHHGFDRMWHEGQIQELPDPGSTAWEDSRGTRGPRRLVIAHEHGAGSTFRRSLRIVRPDVEEPTLSRGEDRGSRSGSLFPSS